ncbi:rhomboid family protein [Aspergillus terreus]|uniref:Rhomboid family protein n=1 Tax=Aspergillus terreus TaxID=33178 RepID=A0A5M3Z927_ASPTE|nr:hypothetical protein ATETN484_0012005400 [Aspergillus terreus]GFF19302.1 rhomboid family protein [Aspergillus terreus]
MSNVFGIAWRIPCSGPRPSSLLSPLRSACRMSTPWHPHSIPRPSIGLTRAYHPLTTSHEVHLRSKSALSPVLRPFTTSTCLRAKPQEPVEHGVQLRPEPFSAAEINSIFGPRAKISPQMGNRVLSVLQGRRVDGTLDLDLPADITRSVRSQALEAGLNWLRANYPLDEDAAILARIEREEKEEQEKLIRRAEELGLYKPQSGSYGAELGDENDPYGKSVLKEAREKNEARLLAEQERKRREWLEGEEQEREKLKRMIQKNTALQKFEESAALEVRERADPSQRPVLAWIQKHHTRATEWDMDLSKVTNTSRILRALAATVVTTGLCYVFAQWYEPPARADRLWPSVPPAAATIMTIIGMNVGIFALWRLWPPAWRLLNRYFITVTAYPRPLSLVGNVFSHQTVRHLAANMFVLWVVGTKVHDEIGRGNFLALYLASGVFGSFTSLLYHIVRGNLMVTGLGASGAISGLVAALCLLHADERFTIFFLPAEWQEVFSAKGSAFLTGIVAVEILSMLSPVKAVRMDHVAHLGGYLAGSVWAFFYKKKERERRQQMGWFERMFRNG